MEVKTTGLIEEIMTFNEVKLGVPIPHSQPVFNSAGSDPSKEKAALIISYVWFVTSYLSIELSRCFVLPLFGEEDKLKKRARVRFDKKKINGIIYMFKSRP